MLRTRIVTALILLALVLAGVFLLPQTGWAVLMAGASAVAGWEWGGLMRLGQRARIAGGASIALLCLLWLAVLPATVGAGEVADVQRGLPVHGLAAIFWLVLVPVWMRRKWVLPASLTGWAIGVVLIFPAWLAIVQLRLTGPWTLLGILAAVWVADIGAYFFGCRWGKHKLAPAISPGKTWEGALGGVFTVLVYGLLARQLFALDALPLWTWCLALPLLAAVSIVGDLFESLLKRQAGLKDSSQVLPGHGGVLDRIDSLTSTLPLVVLFWMATLP